MPVGYINMSRMEVGLISLCIICLRDMEISLDRVPVDILTHLGTPLGNVVSLPFRYPSTLISINIWVVLGLTSSWEILEE